MMDIRNVMGGRKIRFGVLPLKPYAILEKTPENRTTLLGSWGQAVISALDYFQLDYEIVVGSSSGKSLGNGSWTGLMEMLRKQKVDISTPLQINPERFAAVLQTNPIIFSSLTFVTKAPGRLINAFTTFKPFSFQIWLLLVITLLLTGAIMTLLDQCSVYMKRNNGEKNWNKTLRRTGEKKTNLIGVIHNYLRRTVTPAGFFSSGKYNTGQRQLALFWAILLLIMTNGYTSSLISRLTSPVTEPAINTLFQLFTLINRGRLVAGSVGSTVFSDTLPKLAISSGFRLASPDKAEVSCPDFESGLESTLRGGYSVVATTAVLELYMPNYGQELFHVAETNLFDVHLSISFPKNSSLAPVFYNLLRRFVDTGLVQHWESQDLRLVHHGETMEEKNAKQKAVERLRLESELSAADTAVPLSLKTMLGIFVVLALGLAGATGFFLFEILLYRTSSRKIKRNRKKLLVITYWQKHIADTYNPRY